MSYPNPLRNVLRSRRSTQVSLAVATTLVVAFVILLVSGSFGANSSEMATIKDYMVNLGCASTPVLHVAVPLEQPLQTVPNQVAANARELRVIVCRGAGGQVDQLRFASSSASTNAAATLSTRANFKYCVRPREILIDNLLVGSVTDLCDRLHARSSEGTG